MPELPEVETVRKGLERYLQGRTFRQVILRRDGLRFPFPKNLAATLTGKTVQKVERRAKYLLIHMTDNVTMLGHLGMTGSFVFSAEEEYQPSRHDHLLFKLSDGSTMVYNDPRRFGVIDLLQTGAEKEHRLLAHLGPEPLTSDWQAGVFCEAIRHKQGAIKTTILDQKVVVGVGNIYACEALFMSRISPRRKASSVAGKKATGIRAKRLVEAVKLVLQEAIEAGGSTLQDFQDVEGKAGYFAHQFQVYDREGKECVRDECSSTIRRIVQAGRSTFYCPTCQR